MATLAERLIADPDAMTYAAPYFGIELGDATYEHAAQVLADGSVVETIDGVAHARASVADLAQPIPEACLAAHAHAGMAAPAAAFVGACVDVDPKDPASVRYARFSSQPSAVQTARVAYVAASVAYSEALRAARAKVEHAGDVL